MAANRQLRRSLLYVSFFFIFLMLISACTYYQNIRPTYTRLMKNKTVSVISYFKKPNDLVSNGSSKGSSNITRLTTISSSSDPGLNYHPFTHPKTRRQLWVNPSFNSDEPILIRRIGYIDDRYSQPFIVLIAMTNDKLKKGKYFAKIIYNDRKESCLPLDYWLQSGHLDLKRQIPEIYVNRILRTRGDLNLKDHTPLYVRVTRNSNCKDGENISENITIWWNKKKFSKPLKYGVCLHKALFDIKDTQLLIDWIEIHKALGVETITVYLEKVTEDIANAVRPYINSGLLDLLDWNLNKVTRDYGQSGVMTECHYMNLFKVEYLGVYDLDEVVVPTQDTTWNELFTGLSKNNNNFDKTASFLFIGLRWHDSKSSKQNIGSPSPQLSCPNSTSSHFKLPFYFTKTIRDDRPGDHPKIIIRPLLTELVQVHGIGRSLPGTEGTLRVDTNIATCHHYRIPDLSDHKRKVRYDPFMSRYKNTVLAGLDQTLCH